MSNPKSIHPYSTISISEMRSVEFGKYIFLKNSYQNVNDHWAMMALCGELDWNYYFARVPYQALQYHFNLFSLFGFSSYTIPIEPVTLGRDGAKRSAIRLSVANPEPTIIDNWKYQRRNIDPQILRLRAILLR